MPFFAATCLWLGPEQMFAYAIYAAVFGGALTLVLLFMRSLPLPATLYSQQWITRLHDSKEGVPLWHRPRGRGTTRLSGYAIHGRARRLAPLTSPFTDTLSASSTGRPVPERTVAPVPCPPGRGRNWHSH